MDAAHETPEQRQNRQFAELRELSELGMDLARDAHAAAKQQIFTPNPAREFDRAATFAAMAHVVRAIVTLELRIERGQSARPTAERPQPLPFIRPAAADAAGRLRAARHPIDPRRPVLRGLLRDAAAETPDRAPTRREIKAAIDEALAADPDGHHPLRELLVTLCRDLGIDIGLVRLGDHLRDWTPLSPVPS